MTLPAVEGAIFANEVAKLYEENRVRALDYDPMGKVHGIMDLGWGVMTMILAQRFGNTVNIIGYHECVNKTYDQITVELKAKHPDYRWGKVFMPHDASHRDPKTGNDHYEVMEALGWETDKVEQIGIENYIEKGRRMFGNVYISDANGCDRLIHCLRRFKYRIAESFCYTAVVADKLVNDDLVIENPYRGLQSGYAA
jgi:phage terminase large subunit